MKEELVRIGEAANLLGVSIDTLRRWEQKKILIPVRLNPEGHRYYRFSDVESLLNKEKNERNLARKWAESNTGFDLEPEVYCKTRDVFQARIEKFQSQLSHTLPEDIASLVAAITGEIGSNSFDHNLGNWPDIVGILFYFDEKNSTVILADRGVGILSTLKRVRPEITDASEALEIAFTERISGRHPETRGNGLKFVREVITSNPLSLSFQTGDAYLHLKQNDEGVFIQQASTDMRGCFATIRVEKV